MPIFDYKCDLCGKVTEKIREASLFGVCCSHCPSGFAIKQLSAPASIRMGTGTYRHDSGMNRTEV